MSLRRRPEAVSQSVFIDNLIYITWFGMMLTMVSFMVVCFLL